MLYNHTPFSQEIDVDAVACDGDVVAMAISEHDGECRGLQWRRYLRPTCSGSEP